MTPSNNRSKTRAGMSLIELLTAAAISASLMTASLIVVRSSYESWRLVDSEAEAAEHAYAAVRHVVRSCRQAQGVLQVSGSSTANGQLKLATVDGDTVRYQHVATGEVEYWHTAAAVKTTLARGLTELRFTGLSADGVTEATSPDKVRTVRVSAAYATGLSGGTRSIQCLAQLRSW